VVTGLIGSKTGSIAWKVIFKHLYSEANHSWQGKWTWHSEVHNFNGENKRK